MTLKDEKNSTVCLIRIPSAASSAPGMNTLGQTTRKYILSELKSASCNPDIVAVVLIGEGRNFSAGADIREFGQPGSPPSLLDLCHTLQEFPKPTISAIRGLCLGGGLEISLCCDFRIASADPSASTRIGLPEVNIGLIPGALGTQNLPRATNVQFALSVITTGRMVSATEAHQANLVHDIVQSNEQLEAKAVKYAHWAVSLGMDVLRRTTRLQNCSVSGNLHENTKLCHKMRNELPTASQGGEAAQAAIQAINASFAQDSTYHQGCQVEADLFWKLIMSVQGRARRHAFFAQRMAQKPSPAEKAAPSLSHKVERVGVVGAGTMGRGIAASFLATGKYHVTLVEVNPPTLTAAVAFLHYTIGKAYVKKAKLSAERATTILKNQLVHGSDLAMLQDCDAVVEAVFEDLSLKQSIFAKLHKIVKKPTALLLTNTSTLDVSAVVSPATKTEGTSSANTSRLPHCAGMHFFSPAHMMPLVEIIAPPSTSLSTIATLRQLTKSIGKIGVVVGNCDGFVGNRMLFPYGLEAFACLEDGAEVGQVDGVLGMRGRTGFGMKMGIFQMNDLAGNDIGVFIRKSKGLVNDPKTGHVATNRTPGMRYTDIGDELVLKLGRVGQKALKGWYDYDKSVGKGRQPLPSPEVARFLAQRWKRHTSAATTPPTSQDILERTLFPLVNEGFKILEEGMARDPGDIDVVYVHGYGWPVWRGGPMFWADHEVGLPYLLSKLEEFNQRFPGSTHFVPSELLRACVASGVGVQEYYNQNKNQSKKVQGQNARSKL